VIAKALIATSVDISLKEKDTEDSLEKMFIFHDSSVGDIQTECKLSAMTLVRILCRSSLGI
jgi:hypothetical protein